MYIDIYHSEGLNHLVYDCVKLSSHVCFSNVFIISNNKSVVAVPAELTNLIIIRGSSSSVEDHGLPSTERNNFCNIQFHMIKYEDLKLVSINM